MHATLPKPVQEFLSATERYDTDCLMQLFARGATLRDEGKEYQAAAIREWSDRQFLGAKVTLKVIGTTTQDEETVISTEVDGNYESWGITEPFYLDFRFTLNGAKITRLRIVDTPGRGMSSVIPKK